MKSNSNNHELFFEQLPPVLRVRDLMDILSISHNTAYQLVRSGQIHSIRVGRCYRIPREAVWEFLLNSK